MRRAPFRNLRSLLPCARSRSAPGLLLGGPNGASGTRTRDLLIAKRGGIARLRHAYPALSSGIRPGPLRIRVCWICMDHRGCRSIWAPGCARCPMHAILVEGITRCGRFHAIAKASGEAPQTSPRRPLRQSAAPQWRRLLSCASNTLVQALSYRNLLSLGAESDAGVCRRVAVVYGETGSIRTCGLCSRMKTTRTTSSGVKNDCDYFVTTDERAILGHAAELADGYGLRAALSVRDCRPS
jgi:hypothetical protein